MEGGRRQVLTPRDTLRGHGRAKRSVQLSAMRVEIQYVTPLSL